MKNINTVRNEINGNGKYVIMIDNELSLMTSSNYVKSFMHVRMKVTPFKGGRQWPNPRGYDKKLRGINNQSDLSSLLFFKLALQTTKCSLMADTFHIMIFKKNSYMSWDIAIHNCPTTMVEQIINVWNSKSTGKWFCWRIIASNISYYLSACKGSWHPWNNFL